MNAIQFLRTRRWGFYRRFLLIALVLVLAIRNYGDRVKGWFGSPEGDVVLTHYEFRPELPNAKPAWIIHLKNQSREFTYDRIELDATYFDAGGAVLQQDRLVLRQKLAPGQEQMVATFDSVSRPGAERGTLRVLKTERVEE
jgi:hypothetical protein